MRDWNWSPAEKRVARKAFETALERKFKTVIRETKERAARITEPEQLWKLERWLSESRKEIDRTFDFRYSVLPSVFGALLREGTLSEEDLQGLDPYKLDAIRLLSTI